MNTASNIIYIDKIEAASIIIYVDDITSGIQEISSGFSEIDKRSDQFPIIVLNKSDLLKSCDSIDIEEAVSTMVKRVKTISISALEQSGLKSLKTALVDYAKGLKSNSDVIITNMRHEAALRQTMDSLNLVTSGLKTGIPSDLIALDLRHALHHMGTITGNISTDDLLSNIFSNFCIGK